MYMLGVVLGFQERKQEDPKQCWDGDRSFAPNKARLVVRIQTWEVTFVGLNTVIWDGNPETGNI